MIGRKLLSHTENMIEQKDLILCSQPDLVYNPRGSYLLSVGFTFLIYEIWTNNTHIVVNRFKV